MVTIVQRYFV